MLNKELEKIKDEVLRELAALRDSDKLRELEVKILGRKGVLTAVLRQISEMSEADKKAIGSLANDLKNELAGKFREARDVILKVAPAGRIDPTLPGSPLQRGHVHPLSQITAELEDVFSSLGFMILDGPELESDYYNFTALNVPPYHPARDIQDTVYVESKGKNRLLMRTQTSPVQVRAMEKFGAPLRCVVPGRVFRFEATDANHDNTFHQIEGLMIDRDIAVADLAGTLRTMLSAVFGREVTIRFRPGYFPFVEPGLEVDMQCLICGGTGCPSCKHEGWLEMLGAGLVHPRVLEAGGIDPKEWSGFAFGMGIDRLAMMKYGIGDIRHFHGGDLRFLEQF